MLILQLGRGKSFTPDNTPIDFLSPAHCTLTLRQSNNVRAITLLANRLLQDSIYFYYQQRSFHLKF